MPFCNFAQIILRLKKSNSASIAPSTTFHQQHSEQQKSSRDIMSRSEEGFSKMADSFIHQLPNEILDKVFDNLETENLKVCRQVCRSWNKVISSKKSFIQNLCIFQNNYESSKLNHERALYFQTSGVPLQLTSFRLYHLYFFWSTLPPSLFQWMNARKIGSNVKWLEISSSQLKILQLLEILGEMPNLETLRVTGDTILHPSYTETPSTRHNPGKEVLKKIVHLHFHFEDLHAILVPFENLGLLEFCNLETLDLKGNAGNTTDAFKLGSVLVKILNQNASTLKVFRFDNFSACVQGALNSKLSSKYLLRSSLYSEFPRFLSDISWGKLNDFGKLEEISLQRFPIANMNESQMQRSLLPFLSSIKSLKKIQFSQLYFPQDLHFEKFCSAFPLHVKISITSTHLTAPALNLENIEEVVHAERNILKYRDACAEIGFRNIDWRIIYLTWSTIQFNPVMIKYGQSIQRLILKNVLFQIGDEEMNFIAKEMKSLEILVFESCDLSNLTDSGITGLSQSAIDKIWGNEGYEPHKIERVSDSLQSLRGLRSVKLSNVGGGLSQISFLRCFQVMGKLRSLIIHQKPSVIREDVVENFRQQRNIFIEYLQPEA